MKMIRERGRIEVNVIDWATIFGMVEFYFTDEECEPGRRVAVVYGPEGDVVIGAVDMASLRGTPGFFPPSPVTKNMLPPPGWKWAS